MKLRVAFWLLAAAVAFLFYLNLVQSHYPLQASVAVVLFNPITWGFIVVAIFYARRAATH